MPALREGTVVMILRKNPVRSGFTMIELIVVILIILVLAALLLPAVMGAWNKSKFVQQVDDMGKLTAGLEAFKQKYGMYPPSRIRLREGTAYNTTEAFDAHSLKMLKAIWPSFNPVTVSTPMNDPNTATVAATRRYLWCCDRPNKIGDPTQWTDTYELEGDECLVFFLGGIAQFDRTLPNPEIILHGFTRRANDPSGIPNAAIPATISRDSPFVEFQANRLFVRNAALDQVELPPSSAITAATATSPTVGHAFPNAAITRYLNTTVATALKLPSYLALGPSGEDRRPWAYFSAYDTNGGYGYRPDDCNWPTTAGVEWFEAVDPSDPSYTTTPAQQRFQIKFLPPRTSGGNTNYVNTVSGFPNPYTESAPYGMPDAGGLTVNGAAVRWHNPNRFQLISPGSDGKYGPGGQIPRNIVGTDAPPDATYSDVSSSGSSFDNATNISGSQRLGEFNETQKNK
jgi:prepilin-type N-terminal cleavage/methylation domain-containing protein